ncbi:MAG: hypothetical protein EOP60_14745 [Sphingomonadales bacterium]|nr:MAG: hypothetical protein EOP60_14745 [Sphingomonadales bacterium]
MAARFRDWLGRHRALIGKFFFEFVIIVVGVTIAFALEGVRQDREDARYRESMIAALLPTLDNVIDHNDRMASEMTAKLSAFDRDIAAGKRPALPVYREGGGRGGERPPTRAWDGIVSTGAARALSPELFFELSLFYTRQESVGERYIRYNDFTESRVLALGPDPSPMYDAGGKLKPEFSAHIDRLRDILAVNDLLTTQANGLRGKLDAFLQK